MSERILETLMQLFALIAGLQIDDAERKCVVTAFLSRLLNQELVKKYLKVYDETYEDAKMRLEKSTPERREGAIAIRITKLCNDINEQGQFSQEQRIVVVIQALEFCKTGRNNISPLELGFIATLAEGLNITNQEFETIKKFVLNNFDEAPESNDILIISGDVIPASTYTKYLHKDMLRGQIWVLHVGSANIYFLRFTGTGELTMNGQLLQEDKVYPISQGSSVKGYNISPVYYWDITMQFLNREFSSSRVVYEVKNLEYRFRTGEVGIHHMSFNGESGRMVGIMGASGAGKSTLLSVLNGINSPSDGEVLINGVSIHKERERIKGLIGYVSQDDLLIEELTVYENLYFNAKLCFGNLEEEAIDERVNNTLNSLGLYEIKNMKVGSPLNKKISGGQRKRLNISLELIREPAILFLDEPTSGLSSRDSENILDLLKELAGKGKLLFIVIHQPSSDIFKMFDKLIILDTGGYMIYNGNPIDSIEYFKKKIGQANYNESECYVCGNVNPEQIFNIVETRVFTESGEPTGTRRISPAEWRKLYESEKIAENQVKKGPLPEINFRTPDKFRQFLLFAKRDLLSKIADLQYLLVTLLEAPVLALFLSFLIRYYDESAKNPSYSLIDNNNLPIYIFISVIIALFVGLTVSAEEIIKDRKILKRETFLNLSWNSYLMSKVFVQFTISAIQAFSFVMIGNSIMGIKGMFIQYWLVLFSCWAFANMLGLVISDSFKAVVTIYILIPFLVIPQIILSGVLVKFEKLNPQISSPVTIPFYGEMITARWGYEALAVKHFVANKYERNFYRFDKTMSEARFKKDYWNSKLKGDLERILTDVEKGTRDEDFKSDLLLISNEIRKEQNLHPEIKSDYNFNLTPEKINPEMVRAALEYIELVRKYNVRKYNVANNGRDGLIIKFESENREAFQRLKNEYFNTSLEESVTAKNDPQKIIEYKGELIQKFDPVYLDPEHKFIKAHFYSPTKQLFGRYIDTYAINVAIIWIMTILLYLILYFRLLKKLLSSGERFFGKRTRGSDRELL
jgi:ABC-type multidrug transport system ATPase subunit